VSKTQQIGRRRKHLSSALSADQDGEEAVSYFTGKKVAPSPWASGRSVSKTQQIGWGRRHLSSMLSADQDCKEAVLDFTGKKGSTVTMGIRKVSVQNSADWQGEEASQ
jgi:hypothetical protein